MDIIGSPNIGAYALATDQYVILPSETPSSKAKRITETLSGTIIYTSIGGSILIGVLAVANSNGVILPHYATDEEVEAIRSAAHVNVDRIESKRTALGNLVLANDHGAVADPQLMRQASVVKKIGDILGVEVVEGEVAGLPYVGSLTVATNKAALAHPMLKDNEQKQLQNVLKVPVEVGTVNSGVPFVKSGLLVNEHGAVVGSETSGPEIFIISNLFGL